MAVIAGISAVDYMYSADYQIKRANDQVTSVQIDLREKLAGNGEATFKNGYRSISSSPEELERRLSGAWDTLAELKRDLPYAKIRIGATAFGAWLAACILLYALGCIAGWVYQGFRPSKKSTP
jgi:hypothetical protein